MSIHRSTTRISSFCYSVASALFLVAQHSSSLAGTIPVTVIKDTALELDVKWSGAGIDDGSNNDSLAVPALSNWKVGPDPITLRYQDPDSNFNWHGPLTVQHTVGPHGEGVGSTVTFEITFNPVTSSSTESKFVAHGDHKDIYTLTYSWTANIDNILLSNFTAELKGYHVPEPSSVTLLCLGTLGMVAVQLRSRRNGRRQGKR